MRSGNEHQEPIEGPSYRELQLLSEVDADPEVTQRQLSRRVGIALGLTNTLLRNLTQKGYVRATRANWKSWLYSLTPEGFSRKIRLTVAYVQRFVDHYQRVRQTLREQLEPLALNEESRIAMYGTGELAELVYLGLKEIGIDEIDVFGPNGLEGHRFLGMPVRDLSALRPERYDRVLLALLQGWEVPHGALQERGVTPEKLVTFFGDNRVTEGV